MNRFRKAWLALMGQEPEVRTERVEIPVIGEPLLAKLYVVNVPDKSGQKMVGYGGNIMWAKTSPAYYATCAQAHAAHPDLYVKEVQAICVGGAHLIGDLKFAEVQPKPKRAKGRA